MMGRTAEVLVEERAWFDSIIKFLCDCCPMRELKYYTLCLLSVLTICHSLATKTKGHTYILHKSDVIIVLNLHFISICWKESLFLPFGFLLQSSAVAVA
mmetsp:Transcript_45885/g.139358  ORF Transcript_45885/g.139358 Transcript_45885/m.139358 type:complete len:99 (+) Transcript_45885:1-297(+)